MRRRFRQYPVEARPVLVPTPAETVTLDKWFAPWVQPTAPRRRRPVPDLVAPAIEPSGELFPMWFATLHVPPAPRRPAIAGGTGAGETLPPFTPPDLAGRYAGFIGVNMGRLMSR